MKKPSICTPEVLLTLSFVSPKVIKKFMHSSNIEYLSLLVLILCKLVKFKDQFEMVLNIWQSSQCDFHCF